MIFPQACSKTNDEENNRNTRNKNKRVFQQAMPANFFPNNRIAFSWSLLVRFQI